MTDAHYTVLQSALALEGVRVSVRTDGAIAEVLGPLDVRRGDEWLTLGAEHGSHIHLKAGDIAELRFSTEGRPAIEVVDGAGRRLCRITVTRKDGSRA